MNISVSQTSGRVPVTVIKLDGQLDGQNFQELISKAQELHGAGARDFLLDLSDLTYISSAGLVALHSVALMARGEQLPDLEGGWSAYRSMGRSGEAGVQKHVKLLNPRSEIMGVLDMVGFSSVFEIYTDREEAVNSF
ncbi:MAG TPA: STAS domain-containing protein [Anaerolineales bacterium]|jgi:anti-anti-sigma factor|nr:STAS domain-containing protein [Anaerolineales bacterium]